MHWRGSFARFLCRTGASQMVTTYDGKKHQQDTYIDREQLLKETIEFAERPEVASFYIGKTGPDLSARLSGYDHKDAGRWEGKTIIGGLVEESALDIEEYLCLEFRHPKYDRTPIGHKYYGRGERHRR